MLSNCGSEKAMTSTTLDELTSCVVYRSNDGDGSGDSISSEMNSDTNRAAKLEWNWRAGAGDGDVVPLLYVAM